MLNRVGCAIATNRDDGGARTGTVRRVLGYLRPHRLAVAAALGCLFIETALALAPFLIVRQLIVLLQAPRGGFSSILIWAGAGLGLVVVTGLVGVLRSWIVLRITTDIVTHLRRQLMDRLLGQSIGYFTKSRGGDLMSRLLNDVNVIKNALGNSALALVGSIITALGCVVVMVVVQWQLALVTIVILPPLAYLLRRAGRPVYRTRLDLQERLSAFSVHAQEVVSLSGVMLVKAFGRDVDERQQSHSLADEVRRSDVRASMTARWVGLGFQINQALVPLVLLVSGAWLIKHHLTTLGTVIAFVTVLALRFGASVASAGNAVVTVIGALPAWDRIFTVLDTGVEIRERPGAKSLERPRGAVRFNNVTFVYPRQRRPAIRGVSLDVAAGELVALVGPSGAGKTTLTSLLARFYDPQVGSVEVDGHDLRDLRLRSIGDAIAPVLQDTYLFHGSLRENLLYAAPDADEERLAAACRDAHLDAVVAGLPDGLDTVVGERGHRLSGGEKQRVAIARVILKDSPILILDEATSHLDTASERCVQAALSRLFAGRTSFVIAHRLSTVLAADRVVVLNKGRIVEQGTHPDLLAAGGLYATLYDLQFRGGGYALGAAGPAAELVS